MDHPAVEFLSLCGRLKHLDRKGWTYFPIPKVETVACHMYRMAMCVFLLPRSLDLFKVMKIALVHDVGESIIGDLTPRDQVTVEHKREIEEKAVSEIASLLPPEWARSELFELWREYEDGVCPEAEIARDLDKYDMILQAYEYEKAHEINLNSFFESTREVFKTDIVKAWAAHLYELRRHLHNTSLD